MNTRLAQASAARLVALLPAALAWTMYLPVGAKYAVVLTGATAAIVLLQTGHRWAELPRQPGARAAAALLAVLVLSALWSIAPVRDIGAHLGLYGQLLLLPLLNTACGPRAARQTWPNFVLASALVGALFIADRLGLLAPSILWSSTVTAEGNQRICNSLLLALGGALGLWLASQPALTLRQRAGWCGAAAISLLGLSLQDRRTGMVLLPFVLLAWGLARQPTALRRLGITLAVVLAAALAWQTSGPVQSRFAEGMAELRAYSSSEPVATSWGQRLRMLEVTLHMVRERPWLGHGVASWEPLWHERTASGTRLAANRTPHNEYLHIAVQAGLAGMILWCLVLTAGLRTALRAGPAGIPALMMWTAIAVTGLFNAVLRDAKFALPLLTLATMAMASCRPATAAPPAAQA